MASKRKPKKAEPKKRIVYSQDLAAKICELVGGGLCLKEICELPGMPGRTTACKWLGLHDDFANMYARAREERADLIADEIVTIADSEPDPNKARVRIDARKWWAAKVNPKKYGDKVSAELTGKDGGPIETKELGDIEAAQRVAYMLGRAMERQRNAASSTA